MRDNRKHLLLVTLISLYSFAYSQDNIEFQIVTTGSNTWFSPVPRNNIIENEADFSAFYAKISRESSRLSYYPDFNSVQVIAIVYDQSEMGYEHSISTITLIDDTVWVDIHYAIPVMTPGREDVPGYTYQIIAIPKQSKPISFRLIQLTSKVKEHNHYRSGVRVQYPVVTKEYNLSGRTVRNNSVQCISVLRLYSNGSIIYNKKN
jgi:hypothetical protein